MTDNPSLTKYMEEEKEVVHALERLGTLGRGGDYGCVWRLSSFMVVP